VGPADTVGKFFEMLFGCVLYAFLVDVEDEDLVAFFCEVAGECSADACSVVQSDLVSNHMYFSFLAVLLFSYLDHRQ